MFCGGSVSDLSPHERALAAFEIDDVLIVELRCKVVRDFNQSAPIEELRFLHKFEIQRNGIVQTRKQALDSEEFLVFRYYIDGGVRLIRPEVPPDREEFTEQDILAEIEGTVAVDYTSSKDLREDLEAVAAFGPNVVFHAWPYWRAAISSVASDMRLPRIVLPMLRQSIRKPVNLESSTQTTAEK
jgi:hypothetical protein